MGSEPVQCSVSEGRQILGGISTENRAAILVERRVAHVMQPVFNGPPVASRELQQRFGIAPLGTRNRRDVVSGFHFASAVYDPLTNDADDLIQAGPPDVILQRCGGRDGASLKATVPLFNSPRSLLLSTAFPLDVGGKRLPGLQ